MDMLKTRRPIKTRRLTRKRNLRKNFMFLGLIEPVAQTYKKKIMPQHIVVELSETPLYCIVSVLNEVCATGSIFLVKKTVHPSRP